MKVYNPEGKMVHNNAGFSIKVLEKYMQEGTIIEAPAIKCDSDMTLYFDLGYNIKGVMPKSEFRYSPVGKEPKTAAIANRVASYTCFLIKDIIKEDDDSYRLELSRREAQKECYDNYISKLKLGQVINARITHVESYGAFCDIGCGIIALLPIENFCVTKLRGSNTKDALRWYRDLKVIVRSFDASGRIVLSQKELLGTWSEEAAKFNNGDIVVGTVRLVEEYGVFVELTPNLAGLADPYEGVKVGDIVAVLVKNIIPERMKIKLTIINTDTVAKIPAKLDYKIPESGFVKYWLYSPDGATKKFETIIED